MNAFNSSNSSSFSILPFLSSSPSTRVVLVPPPMLLFLDRTGCGRREARVLCLTQFYMLALSAFFFVFNTIWDRQTKKKERIFHLLLCPIHRSSSFFHILYLMAYGICDLSTPLKKKKKREEKERERSSSQKKIKRRVFFSVFLFTFERDPPVVPGPHASTRTQRDRERERKRKRERETRARFNIRHAERERLHKKNRNKKMSPQTDC